MTKHDLKELSALGAELAAAKAEVQLEMERHRKTWRQLEQVRGLLQRILNTPRGTSGRIIIETDEEAEIHAALSQQAEPAPANQCDGCQAGVMMDENGNHRMGKPGGYADLMRCEKGRYVSEPAPAQDEPDMIARLRRSQEQLRASGHTLAADDIEAKLASLTRPAQAEQQPVVPEGWKLVPVNPSLEMIAALGFGGDELLAVGHGAIFADMEQLWRKVLDAAPIAQTAPQPELVMPVALGSVNADYDKGWADHAAEVVRLNAALSAQG